MKFEEFRQIWSKARAACPEDFLHEKFFTTDKVTKSLYNFVEGADPKLIYQAFKAGLINNIYPSHNLQELRHFPQPMVDFIKNFQKKVLKAKDDPIYVKVISSILDWQQEEGYDPYHFLEIGLAKSKKEISQSQPMEEQQLLLNNLSKIKFMYDSFSLNAKVHELILNGEWIWPTEWYMKYPSLVHASVPTLNQDVPDMMLWKDLGGWLTQFSVSLAWQCIRLRENDVP
ncbi:hypothetical protein Tco_0472807 [Tanacetum coccineum]